MEFEILYIFIYLTCTFLVQILDYYMDTDYNSDPDKFKVKELLLNVVLDSQQ